MAYANGDSMIRSGIFPGDILIIDRSLHARDGDVVIALLHGEFTVKQVSIINENLFLVAQNKDYLPIKIPPEMEFEIWGVVTYSIHRHQ